MSKPKLQKTAEDLGIKIGTEKEVIWTEVLKEAESLIQGSERSLIVQLAIRDLAMDKIKQEASK